MATPRMAIFGLRASGAASDSPAVCASMSSKLSAEKRSRASPVPTFTVPEISCSVDSRFCDYGAPVFVTNLEPHHGWRIEGLDWDGIYERWESDDLRYYWRDYPNITRELVHG